MVNGKVFGSESRSQESVVRSQKNSKRRNYTEFSLLLATEFWLLTPGYFPLLSAA